MDKVLIVDDDKSLLKLIEHHLKGFSDKFITMVCDNGTEAFQMLSNHEISLIVTDIMMPEFNGLDLLAFANEFYPEIPCIAMSAHEAAEFKEQLPDSVLEILRKPFQVQELSGLLLKKLAAQPPEDSPHGISVSSFAKLIEMEQATAILHARSRNGEEKGLIVFRDGLPLNARMDELTGEPAAIGILGLDRPVVTIDQNVPENVKPVIQSSLKELIERASGA